MHRSSSHNGKPPGTRLRAGVPRRPMGGWLGRRRRFERLESMFTPIPLQIKAWRKASRKMGWKIPWRQAPEFDPAAAVEPIRRGDGYCGTILCFGFGDDGSGHADAVLSGKLAWAYAERQILRKTWQCRYVAFEKQDHFRLRPGAPPRPKGFYLATIWIPAKAQQNTISRFLKSLTTDTGVGPEGIQLLTVTHPHIADFMNQRRLPFMAFADYDVAPHGFSDFYDALQMFCSNDTLGLGLGHIDRNYPLFGIPALRLETGISDPIDSPPERCLSDH